MIALCCHLISLTLYVKYTQQGDAVLFLAQHPSNTTILYALVSNNIFEQRITN